MKTLIQFYLLAILVCSFGCAKTKISFPEPPENALADSFISETKPFVIGSETYMADFGTITVQENRTNHSSRLISIPFLRIHSKSENPSEPVFGLAGGPGMSNMSRSWKFVSTFLADHDFVLVGYRGVDGSSVLDCPEVADAFKGSGDLLSGESMKTIGKAWNASAGRLVAQGVDLEGYTMLECIEDFETVRGALGYKRINLLSESYGTRVAYHYGLKYPEHIFRSAMIGVNPPGRFVWESQVINEQLKYYSNLWSKDSIMTEKSADLYATVHAVLKNMPRSWFLMPIDPGKVRVVTFFLLFHRQTAAMAFDAYIAAEKGDASGLALMSMAYNFVVPSLMTWGDLAAKAVSADFDSSRKYSSNMEPSPGAPLGSPMGQLLWGPLDYGYWPNKQLPAEYRNPQYSDVETLLISGSIDFSTPAQFATNELLPYLKNGKQVIISECGHVGDLLFLNQENTKTILRSFYQTGEADISLNKYIPMDFSVKWGFPLIAKTVVGAIGLLIIVLVAVVVWFIKRRSAKRAR